MYNNIASLLNFQKTITVLDLETTGLTSSAKIIQFASKTFQMNDDYSFPCIYAGVEGRNGFHKDVRVMNYIVNPKCHVPKLISELTGITKDQINNGVLLEDIKDDIINTVINTEIIVTYNGDQYDMEILANNLAVIGSPLNYKKSKHFKNISVSFLDIRKVVDAEVRGVIFTWCEAQNREPNLKLQTVYDFITYRSYLSLGLDVPKEETNFHDGMFDVNATLRILIGLVEIFNVNLMNYITNYTNMSSYTLSLEKDANVILTRRGIYKDMTLKDVLEMDKNKKKSWLLSQHNYKNLTLDIGLQNILKKENHGVQFNTVAIKEESISAKD
jgi:DNA polymerase III epsilon subunit-like protein